MKVTAPLMSLDASGTIGKAFVASKWKGRNYMRRHVVPSNPQTDAQTSNRALMAFLSQFWKLMSGVDQGGWNALAAQGNFSPFNAFVQTNMNRWKQFQYPIYQPTVAGVNPTAPVISSVVGGKGQFQLNLTEGAGVNNWGTVAFVQVTVDPTAAKVLVDNVSIVNFVANLAHAVIIPNLAPGTYRAKVLTFSKSGTASALSASSGDIAVA